MNSSICILPSPLLSASNLTRHEPFSPGQQHQGFHSLFRPGLGVQALQSLKRRRLRWHRQAAKESSLRLICPLPSLSKRLKASTTSLAGMATACTGRLMCQTAALHQESACGWRLHARLEPFHLAPGPQKRPISDPRLGPTKRRGLREVSLCCPGSPTALKISALSQGLSQTACTPADATPGWGLGSRAASPCRR